MSTNLKTKKENWTGKEVAILLEEVEKSKPFLFEIVPINRDMDVFKGHVHLHTHAGSCQLR